MSFNISAWETSKLYGKQTIKLRRKILFIAYVDTFADMLSSCKFLRSKVFASAANKGRSAVNDRQYNGNERRLFVFNDHLTG